MTIHNEDGFYKLRDEYDKTREPLLLFVLSCFSFNHQLGFNKNGNFNMPFGRNRSYYNDVIKGNLIGMKGRIDKIDITFSGKDFREVEIPNGAFVYCDPPYLATDGTYNHNRDGNGGWWEKDDKDLFDFLDNINDSGCKFAMSNVLSHHGVVNKGLSEWSNKYFVTHLNFNYKNSNYQKHIKDNNSDEVLITNYTPVKKQKPKVADLF